MPIVLRIVSRNWSGDNAIIWRTKKLFCSAEPNSVNGPPTSVNCCRKVGSCSRLSTTASWINRTANSPASRDPKSVAMRVSSPRIRATLGANQGSPASNPGTTPGRLTVLCVPAASNNRAFRFIASASRTDNELLTMRANATLLATSSTLLSVPSRSSFAVARAFLSISVNFGNPASISSHEYRKPVRWGSFIASNTWRLSIRKTSKLTSEAVSNNSPVNQRVAGYFRFPIQVSSEDRAASSPQDLRSIVWANESNGCILPL